MSNIREGVNDLQIKLIVPAAKDSHGRKSSHKAEKVEKVDVHLSMSKDKATGQNTMTIGSKINDKWTDMSLSQETAWWNRLHYIPQRYLQDKPQKARVPSTKAEADLHNIRLNLQKII